MSQSCVTCRFWGGTPEKDESILRGECLRHPPPAAYVTAQDRGKIWPPRTEPWEWCGEWQLKPELQPKTVSEMFEMLGQEE